MPSLRRHDCAKQLRRMQNWADATVMLGGGGARGLAHLGVMRAIGQSGLSVGRMVGVSMGALMAALCAVHRDVQRAESIARDFLTSDDYLALQKRVMGTAASASDSNGQQRSHWMRRWRRLLWAQQAIGRAARSESLLPATILESIVNELLPDIQIDDLSTPLHLIAVDLEQGERVVLSSGSLRQAVVASMSIPGVFPLVEMGGRRLGDVGVYDAVPCDLVRQCMKQDGCASELIVVDVSRSESAHAECQTALQAVLRFQELAEERIRQHQLEHADIVIRPQVGSVAWFDFTNPDPIIDSGYQAARTVLSDKVMTLA